MGVVKGLLRSDPDLPLSPTRTGAPHRRKRVVPQGRRGSVVPSSPSGTCTTEHTRISPRRRHPLSREVSRPQTCFCLQTFSRTCTTRKCPSNENPKERYTIPRKDSGAEEGPRLCWTVPTRKGWGTFRTTWDQRPSRPFWVGPEFVKNVREPRRRSPGRVGNINV